MRIGMYVSGETASTRPTGIYFVSASHSFRLDGVAPARPRYHGVKVHRFDLTVTLSMQDLLGVVGDVTAHMGQPCMTHCCGESRGGVWN